MSEITVKDLQKTDLLVSVDIETTGLDPFLHDMWEIAIIPFIRPKDIVSNKIHNSSINIGKFIILSSTFKARMRPQQPANMQAKALEVGNITKDELMKIPTTLYQVLNAFYEWKLEIYPEYRFLPVGHNYVGFDKQFLISKMNYFNYDQNFSHNSLDTKVIAKWLHNQEKLKAPKLSLQGLRKFLNLDLDIPEINCEAHTAYGDALMNIALLNKLELI